MSTDTGNNFAITDDMWQPTNDSRDLLKEAVVPHEGTNFNVQPAKLNGELVTKSSEFGFRRSSHTDPSPEFLEWMSGIDFATNSNFVINDAGRITLFIDLNRNFLEGEEE